MTVVEKGLTCAHCGSGVHPGDAFCEACGAAVLAASGSASSGSASSGSASPGSVDQLPAPTPGPLPTDGAGFAAATSVLDAPHAQSSLCELCGGAITDDGFCDTCGAKARTWRDHWTETPAPWVGAVCDKGIRHARNEDALATAATASATEPGAYAVLVVCDGVTSAPDSDQASLAAATEACDHLVGAARAAVRHGGAPVTNAAAVEASVRALSAAGRVAQVAVLGVTERLAQAAPGGVLSEPPSCTFVAAVLTGRRLAVGWCGDSRAYWLGDDGDQRQLSIDHSLASELIAGGMSRVEAEQDPTAHTITRWLGADSANSSPDTVTLDVAGSGWLLVCSDGLWNYASSPAELAALVAAARADGATSPTAIAESLAAYSNDRGGHDNISVALARVEPEPEFASLTEPLPPPEET